MTRRRVRRSSAAGSPASRAALRCADAGAAVTLLETRPRLGGLTSSFRRGELTIDNGQHVFLRCCTAYRALLDRLGVSATASAAAPARRPGAGARRRDRPAAPRAAARAAAPGRLAAAVPALLAWPSGLASPGPRWPAVRTRDDPATDEQRFGDWLTAHGQSERGDRGAVGPGRRGHPQLAGGRRVPRPRRDGLPGSALLSERRRRRHRLGRGAARRAARRRAARPLADAGAEVRGWSPRGRGDAAAGGGLAGAGRSGADRRKPTGRGSASSWRAAGRRGPAAAARGRAIAAGGHALGTSPIVNVHVVLRPARCSTCRSSPVSDTPVQWVFDRTAVVRAPRRPVPGGVAVRRRRSTSTRRPRQLREQFLPALTALLPGGRARRQGAGLLRHPGAARHVPPRARQSPRCARPPGPRCPACSWPARGPPPAGRRPWKARCAAGVQPRPRCSTTPRPGWSPRRCAGGPRRMQAQQASEGAPT